MPSEIGGQEVRENPHLAAPKRQESMKPMNTSVGLPPAATNTEIGGQCAGADRDRGAPKRREATNELPTSRRMPLAVTNSEIEGLDRVDTQRRDALARQEATQHAPTRARVPPAVTDARIGGRHSNGDHGRDAPKRQRATRDVTASVGLPSAATDAEIEGLDQVGSQRHGALVQQGASMTVATDVVLPPAAINTELEGLSSADHRQKNALSGERAGASVPSITMLPAAAHNDEFGGQITADSQCYRAPDGERATADLLTNEDVPVAVLDDEIGGQDRVGDRGKPASSGGRAEPVLATDRSLPAAANIAALSELQRQRRFCIKSQSRTDRACEAFIARYLGYTPDTPKPEGLAIWKQAAALRRAVEKGGQGQKLFDNRLDHALSACSPIILNSAAAREAWDNHRAQTEKQMRKLATTLPVYAWAKGIAGFGELGLAIIIGETGDLSNYATKDRVWKRLGLAVIGGERQQRKSGAEAAAAHGYNPTRRAEIWTLGDSLFRHQWSGAKDDTPAGPKGPYGAVYAARKAHTVNRDGWTPARRENDARRVMCKFLLENTWRVWNGRRPLEPSELGRPRAEIDRPMLDAAE